MELPSVEEMMQVLDTPYAMVPPTEEEESEEMETNGLLLIEILKAVTRIETKIDMDEEEDKLEKGIHKVDGMSSGFPPTSGGGAQLDAILLEDGSPFSPG